MHAQQLQVTPPELLYDYQRRWLRDPSPFKIGLWARQTGKDFTCAAEAVFDSIAQPRNHWLIIGCGERQAIESLQHAKYWADFLKSETRNQKSEIIFHNGSRITALPAKPETIRGYSANLILTEFAFQDHPDDIWRAVFPILTNPLKGGRKKLRIISTPNGHSNRFHELWQSADFAKHKVTIHEAVEAGLPIDIPLLQRGLVDSEAWAQEYECQFLDQSSVLLPYDLIASCESAEATESSTPELISAHRGELFLGIDFGRKHDLTVAWLLERIATPPNHFAFAGALAPRPAHLFVTREILVLEKASVPDQLEALIPRVQRVRRACVDYTGPGIGLGDLLADQFGEFSASNAGVRIPGGRPASSSGRVELCTFTQPFKNEVFSHLRAAFERRLLAIPVNLTVREDLHALHRVLSANGQISYRATGSPDGHSDRCTALALALRAAESAPVVACAANVGSVHSFGRFRR